MTTIECLACDLASGNADLPGGRIHATDRWLVEHCVGPLGVGTLVVKPLRHCLHVWDLTDDEATELGPLLRRTAAVIAGILQPDQIYTCLWSHGGWEPVHIHFVVQPVWNHWRNRYPKPGPSLQVDMFRIDNPLPRDEVERFAQSARDRFRRAGK